MRKIILFLGKTGCGKSFRLLEYIKQQPRLIIYNSVAEPQYDCFQRVEGISNLAEIIKENKPIFRVNYSWSGELDQTDDYDYVCRLVYASKSIVFVTEEVSLFCSPSYIPRSLAKIISLGRHRDISFYCTSQTPKQINTLVRSQASEIVSFRQTEPAHIDWCRDVMGEDADKINQLKDFHCLRWTPNSCQILDKNYSPLDKQPPRLLESSKITEGKPIDSSSIPNPNQ